MHTSTYPKLTGVITALSSLIILSLKSSSKLYQLLDEYMPRGKNGKPHQTQNKGVHIKQRKTKSKEVVNQSIIFV